MWEVHSTAKRVKCTIAFGAHGCSRRANLLRRSRAGSTEAQVIALERAKTQSELARRNHERALYLMGVAVVQADVDRGPARDDGWNEGGAISNPGHSIWSRQFPAVLPVSSERTFCWSGVVPPAGNVVNRTRPASTP
jgi:hypothetical protein